MITTEQLQGILKNKSTTFVRKICDKYFIDQGFEKWKYNKNHEKWCYSEFDCRRRLRTICRFYDGKHELTIALRKKAGYYFLIEYDRHRIFECDPDILVLEEESLNNVTENYSELFNLLVA